jgi:ATP-dependent DNA ligase
MSDAQTEVNKKLKAGYVTELDKAKSSTSTATIDKPAKGLPFHPYGKNNATTIDSLKLRGATLGVQTKIDGWRMRVKTDGDTCEWFTSSGDVTNSFPLIEQEILLRAQKAISYFGCDYIILDGEIYNHELGFNAVQSACGTSVNLTQDKIELRNKMNFHLFDFLRFYNEKSTPEIYSIRENILIEWFTGSHLKPAKLIEVPTVWIKEQMFLTLEDQIIDLFDGVLESGYEGLIIRQNVRYEHKKSKQFLKYKPLEDAEFKVIGFTESITTGTLGSIKFESEKGVFSADLKGEVGTDQFKLFIWRNQKTYLSKWATVEFMEYTQDGLPRNPKVKAFRKGQSED